jgi:hypothetical protein
MGVFPTDAAHAPCALAFGSRWKRCVRRLSFLAGSDVCAGFRFSLEAMCAGFRFSLEAMTGSHHFAKR